MRSLAIAFSAFAALTASSAAGGPLNLAGYHAEPMDGANTFPPVAAYVTETNHSQPAGCAGTESDLFNESSAFSYLILSPSPSSTFLPPGGCMDVRRFWLSWDTSTVYLAVEGPNEAFERGDLFVAIDTDNVTGGGVTAVAPWSKAVDFCEWDPEFYIALEAPVSGGGFAALLDENGNQVKQFTDGTDAADSGYLSCDVGGMYYEFAITFAELGLVAPFERQVNFSIYTTFEDDGFDTYDTGPGCGQNLVWEQLGDDPFDADYCNGNHDCVLAGEDPFCGAAESDDDLGAGNSLPNRVPGSDNTGFDVDTIHEYYAITNFGADFPIPVLPVSWGVLKSAF